ncbi:hypothetical protein BGZ76_003907 [Entomortierella beljakovae]|nr:hypothetical protein BGZ76_003907 [Entomortierella beljakovae]
MVDSAQVHSHGMFTLPDFTKHSSHLEDEQVEMYATAISEENITMYDEEISKPFDVDEDCIANLEVTPLSAQDKGAAPIEKNDENQTEIMLQIAGLDEYLLEGYSRKFSFKRNAQLVLGRAPSCGSDSKSRMRQLADFDNTHSLATSLNGKDDGLFANQVISKVHAIIYEKDGQLVLEDKQSTHGTYVNDEKVQSCVLNNSDRVRLGRDVVRKDVPYPPLEFTVGINCTISTPSLNDDDEFFDDQDIHIDEYPELFSDFSKSTRETESLNEDESNNVNSDSHETTALQEISTASQEIEETVSISATMSEPDISPVLDCNQNQMDSTITTIDVTAVADEATQVNHGSGSKRKRSDSDDDIQGPTGNSGRKKTALIAAALTGAVIGSIGTIIALANI